MLKDSRRYSFLIRLAAVHPTMKKGPERPPNERLRASHIQNVLRNQVVTTLDFKFKGVELLIPTSTSSHHRYFRFHVKSGKVHIGKFQVEEDENKTTPKQKWKNLIKLANRQSTNTEGQHDMQEVRSCVPRIKNILNSNSPRFAPPLLGSLRSPLVAENQRLH